MFFFMCSSRILHPVLIFFSSPTFYHFFILFFYLLFWIDKSINTLLVWNEHKWLYQKVDEEIEILNLSMEQKIIVFFLSLLSLFVVLLSFPIIPFLIWFVSFTWWIVCANNGYGFYKKNSSLCFLYFLMTSLWVCDNNTTAAPSRPKRTLKTQHTWVITFKLQPA